MTPLSTELEALWDRLRRHLERAQGFTLGFLFSPSRRVSTDLQRRLAGALLWRTSELQVLDPFSLEDARSAVLRELSRSDEGRIAMRSPVWLVLDRHPGSEQADALRRELLAALNERRGTLETAFRRPLLVVLPAGLNALAWTYAPDLWTIRGFVGELPAGAGATPPHGTTEAAGSTPDPVLLQDGPDARSSTARSEWRRVAQTALARPDAVTPWLAVAASAEALQAGEVSEAAALADAGVGLARQRAQTESTDTARRDLAAALNAQGQVAQARGEWSAAKAAYREMLEVARGLAQQLGTPEARRDVSVPLNNVGRVAQAQGEWSAAKAAYRESLEIARALAQQLGTPESRRDVSVSLDNVGRVAEVQGEWAAAEAAYRESLEIARALAQQLGTPQARRDVSVSLDNVGRVAEVQGEWAAAEAASRESLEIRRALAARLATPEAQRDLLVSLNRIARVAEAQGEWAHAESAYREMLQIARALAARLATPQSKADLEASQALLDGLASRREASEQADPPAIAGSAQ